MTLATFSISRSGHIFTKLLAVSESSIKIKVKLHMTLFVIFLTSAVIHCVKSVRIQSYSGPHFPAFGLNTERYSVSLRVQSECGKMWTRIAPNTDAFCAVIRKKRILHKKEIVQYLQNCKCDNVAKRNFLWTIRTIFKARLILGYFQRLNCHNFCLILAKEAKLHFLESTLKCLKTGQILYSYNYSVRNNGPSKFWKNLLFHGLFLIK